jgi:hypothetical protein
MITLDDVLKKENLIAAMTSVIAFGVYLTTMCPTVSFTDSGELATVAVTLGIAHPTGYPLWTLLARIATMVPSAGTEIVRLNTFSSVLTAVAVGLFFKLVLTLNRSSRIFRFKNEKNLAASPWVQVLSAIVTALIVGFSSTVWAQSVEIEVYALHLVLIILATIFFVRGIEDQLTQPAVLSQRLAMFAFVLGLCFTNHMTTILLAPGFLYLFFSVFGWNKNSRRRAVLLSPFFLLGMSLYFYLPVRSSAGTLLDWGHPVTLERFWWHFTGKQYQTWMFSGWTVAKKQLAYFATNFPTEFHWPVIAAVFVGSAVIFSKSKRLFIFLTLLFLGCLIYTINYDIYEIDPYFALAYLSCGCFIGFGVQRIILWSMKLRSRLATSALVILICVLPVFQVLNNVRDVDQSRNYLVEDFVQNVFKNVEPNALVFSSLWDYFVSPSYYYQIIQKQRPDIILIDRDLLQNRAWYFIQLERRHPEIYSRSKGKIDAFLVELNKYEKGEPFSFLTIQSRWNELLLDLIQKSFSEHPVYMDPRIAGEFPQEFEGVPEGLLVRLVRKGEKGNWKPITVELREVGFSNYVTADLKKYFAAMYVYHALYLAYQGRISDASYAIERALIIDPSFIPARNLKAQLTSRPK